MTNTEKLTYYMRSSNVTIEMLSKKMNISKKTLLMKANNVMEFKTEEINTICDYLMIPVTQRSLIFFDHDNLND